MKNGAGESSAAGATVDKSFSQVLRWGMAGWCLIGELGVFFGLYKLLLSGVGQAGGISSFKLLDGRIAALSDPALMTVVLAALGVPLGYFIYQTYYFLFWTVPWSSDNPPERAVVKRLTEQCPRHSQLDDELRDLHAAWTTVVVDSLFVRLVNGTARLIRHALRRPSIRTPRDVIEFRASWAQSRAAWLQALSCRNEGANVGLALAGERFEYLTSMYDGLGAVMVANWIALSIAFFYKLWRVAYVDYALGSYTVAVAGGQTVEFPVWAALLVLLVIELAIAGIFHRMVWTNRVLLRLSVVTLADSFICRFDCRDPECQTHGKRNSHGRGRSHDDD